MIPQETEKFMSEPSTYMVRHYQLSEQLTNDEITLFKAQDTKKNKAVLIKFILPRKPHAKEFLTRFEETAAAMLKLEHPNLEPVLDYGFQEGVPYLVTPFPGQTLASLKNKPLGWVQAARLLAPLAKALTYLHQNGFLHQNICPETVFISRSGPILGGIGLVKILEIEGSTNLTGTGSGLLSPEYLAPEQWTGKAQPQSDIYSLGILFYELLTGQKPFTSDTRQGLKYKHSSAEIPQAAETVEDIPRAVDLVLHKALAKEPQNRFKNMQEFAQALEILGWGGSSEELKKLLAARPQAQKTSPPPQPVEEIKKKQPLEKKQKSSRRGLALALAVIFLALVAAGLIFLPDILKKADQSPPAAVSVEITPTTAELPNETPAEVLQPETQEPAAEAELTSEATEEAVPTEEPSATPQPSAGSVRTAETDGMQLVYIPAGEFLMGSNDRNADESPQHSVYLDAYWIDRTEVTNAMYAACVQAGACVTPVSSASSTRSSYFNNPDYGNYPVIFINWDQAAAYCEWAGRRLPSEAEWEKAARGEDGNICPWGNSAPANNLLNYAGVVADTSPVGSYPDGASPFGLLDMSGNVWEWTADWYGHDYYQDSPFENPGGPEEGSKRVLKGGSWYYDTNYIRSAFRFSSDIITRLNDVGFRCAVSE